MSCGSRHNFLLDDKGDFWGCGYNGYGQLGVGDKVNRVEWTKIEGIEGEIREQKFPKNARNL